MARDPHSPVTIPDTLDPTTRGQMEVILQAKRDGTPIRSLYTIQKLCDVGPERALALFHIWRSIDPPDVPGKPTPPAPPRTEPEQAADEAQDHADALASAAHEAFFDRDSPPLVITHNEQVIPATHKEPTHADPIDSAPVRDVREPDDHRADEGADRNALVVRPPDDAPGADRGQADGLLPGLPAPTGAGRQARGKGAKVSAIDDPRWHRCADALGRILAVHGGARALAAGIRPDAGRGKTIADTAPKAGWDRYAARLEAVADACEGHPHALSTAARIHAAMGDASSGMTVDGLLWRDGAKLVGALDAALSQPEAAERVSDRRQLVQRAPTTSNGVSAEDVRAAMFRRFGPGDDVITIEMEGGGS